MLLVYNSKGRLGFFSTMVQYPLAGENAHEVLLSYHCLFGLTIPRGDLGVGIEGIISWSPMPIGICLSKRAQRSMICTQFESCHNQTECTSHWILISHVPFIPCMQSGSVSYKKKMAFRYLQTTFQLFHCCHFSVCKDCSLLLGWCSSLTSQYISQD